MTDCTPRNKRERISRKGFRTHQPALIALSQKGEWASMVESEWRVSE